MENINTCLAKVTFGTSSLFAQVVSLVQGDESTLRAGTAFVVVAMPAVPADTEVATVSVTAKVYEVTTSVSFTFERLSKYWL